MQIMSTSFYMNWTSPIFYDYTIIALKWTGNNKKIYIINPLTKYVYEEKLNF